MIRIENWNEVIRFDLSRSFFGKGHYWTTAYYVDELMIDTGCAHSATELFIALKDKPLKKIINTHSHEDHFGGNGLLQKKFENVEIFAHPLALSIISNPKEKQPLQFYRRFMWGYPEPSIANPIKDGEVVKSNSFQFQTIYTPGHSPDHICIYDPDKQWLFSGDLFVGGQDRALRANYDIWQIIDSLKIISKLPIKILFAGSARVRENPISEIQSKINYLEELGSKIIDMNKKGIKINDIIQILFKKKLFIEYFTFGHFSRKNLVLSYLGMNNTFTKQLKR